MLGMIQAFSNKVMSMHHSPLLRSKMLLDPFSRPSYLVLKTGMFALSTCQFSDSFQISSKMYFSLSFYQTLIFLSSEINWALTHSLRKHTHTPSIRHGWSFHSCITYLVLQWKNGSQYDAGIRPKVFRFGPNQSP